MIELRQLKQFVAVAEELSFRRAAARLHMTQPPLTISIRKLEAIVGQPLFERSTRHMSLTPAGAVLLGEAQRTLAQASHAIETARRATPQTTGSLRLSFVASATLGRLPPFVRHFRETYPHVELILDIDVTSEQVRALRRGDRDVALLVGPVPEAPDLTLVPFRRERMTLAVPAAHRLAGRKHVQLTELAAEHFIAFVDPKGPGFEHSFMAACRQAGFYPRIVQRATHMLTKLMLVSTGAGVASVPASMANIHMQGVSYVDVRHQGQPLHYGLSFAYRSDHDNPIVDKLAALARAYRDTRADQGLPISDA